MFETRDVSLVKRYVQRQLRKVMEGRVSLQDLTFAKEYRGMASYKPGACVPALELARYQWLTRVIRGHPVDEHESEANSGKAYIRHTGFIC